MDKIIDLLETKDWEICKEAIVIGFILYDDFIDRFYEFIQLHNESAKNEETFKFTNKNTLYFYLNLKKFYISVGWDYKSISSFDKDGEDWIKIGIERFINKIIKDEL